MIDLLLTDVVMPGLSGPALAERIRAVRPCSNVLFMSGFTAGSLGPSGRLDPGVALLEKPFSKQELLTAISAALDAAHS